MCNQKPFLKWVGGKLSTVDQILPHLPSGNRLIEPFVGGGSVFLNAGGFNSYLLADINSDLINLYKIAASDNEKLIDKTTLLFAEKNNPDDYYNIRASFNQRLGTGLEHAAEFLYLNRHCFNGLSRYSSRKGEFNVSYGKYKKPYHPKNELLAFAEMAGKCEFHHSHYADTIAQASSGDVIFCDPPYEPLPNTTGFTSYAASGFKIEDQRSLLNSLIHANKRGAAVVITNSSSPAIVDMYNDAGLILHDLIARRSVSCKGSTRGLSNDIIGVLL